MKSHKCGQVRCPVCEEKVQKDGHVCYMKPIDPAAKIKRKPVFIFYDIETRQDEQMGDNKYGKIYRHVPTCCIAHKVCETCRNDNDTNNDCAKCGKRRFVFTGDNTLVDFCHWLFSPENRGATAMAHNAKGFDSQFLVQYLQEYGTTAPSVVTKGLEIISLEAGGVRVIDSLNFLPMALSVMPKTFGINELKKGHFPHMFNTRENQNYVGKLPNIEHYNPDVMKPEAHDQVMKWYEAEAAKNEQFDLKKEMVEYCDSDVDILKQCALKFRQIFISVSF